MWATINWQMLVIFKSLVYTILKCQGDIIPVNQKHQFFYVLYQWAVYLRNHQKIWMWDIKGNWLEGGGGVKGQEPISYFSIRLSHTHVEMNKMCLKPISVIIFPKIIFEIEHYECKSW